MKLSETTKLRIILMADLGHTINKIATTLDVKWESVQRVLRRDLAKHEAEELINNYLGKLLNGQTVQTIGSVQVTGPKTGAARNKQTRKVVGVK